MLASSVGTDAVGGAQANMLMAHLTPRESAAAVLGNMTPSVSRLDQLPKQVSERVSLPACRLIHHHSLRFTPRAD